MLFAGVWTEQRVAQLKILHAEGLSGSEIAAALGGVSRNAVIGKIHRLRLATRGKTTRPSRVRKKRPPRPVPDSFAPTWQPAPLFIPAANLPPLRLAILELQPDECRFPVTDETPFLFCGHPQTHDSSYCFHHHKLTHSHVTEAQREARRVNAAKARRTSPAYKRAA